MTTISRKVFAALVAASAAVAVVPLGATAQVNPLAPKPTASAYAGTYDGPQGMSVTLRDVPNGAGAMSGEMTFGGQQFPLTITATPDGKLAGSFRSGNDTFPVTMTPAGNTLTVESGGGTYALTRRAAAPGPIGIPPGPVTPGPITPGPVTPGPVTPGPVTPPPVMPANGQPGGVGIQVNPQPFDGTIVSLMPGGPAERAGIRVGDRIVSVDGRPIQGLDYAGVGNLLRGPAGSTVRVGVAGADGQQRAVDVVRATLGGPGPNPNVQMPPMPGPESMRPVADPAGLWRLSVPKEWKETKTETGVSFDGGDGVTAFVSVLDGAGNVTAQQFFEKNVLPGLQQSGAQFQGGGPVPAQLVGADGFGVQLVRIRNNTPEGGFYFVSVIEGKGIIIAALCPQQVFQQRAGEVFAVQQSVRVGRGSANAPANPFPPTPSFPPAQPPANPFPSANDD